MDGLHRPRFLHVRDDFLFFIFSTVPTVADWSRPSFACDSSGFSIYESDWSDMRCLGYVAVE